AFSFGFMVIASAILCTGIYGLFNALPVQPALWFCLCIAVTVTAYSILSINLNTLGGLWTKDPIAQTQITTLREGCGLVGLVIAVSLPSLLKEHFGEQQAYLYFSLILAAIMILVWLAFGPWLSRHVSTSIPAKKLACSWFAGMKSTSRQTRYFLGVYALSMMASSIPAVLVIFFVRDLLNAEHLTGLFLLLYFLSGALAMPFWRNASARFGKYRAWLFAMLLAVASFIGAFFLGAGDVWQYGLICVFSGLALSADLALPPSILADHVHHHQTEDHAASQYALLALSAKLSLALASAIALPMLGEAGFVPGKQNTDSALLFLSVAYALIPCALKLTAAALLVRAFIYRNQGDAHENNHINRNSGSTHHA
ncbi:MAG: MFS transporter, partial [Alphaproteobacteria bacterium]